MVFNQNHFFRSIICEIIKSPKDNAPFADQDCAAAVENMLLAATALGLGTRYIVSRLKVVVMIFLNTRQNKSRLMDDFIFLKRY
ncbi:nitroreductase family protein [Desulfosporosinus sp.]|uniref:nitroreductase family protein n=1 Tax=Desulfosporosinus sp. TaxID=157907 RepID=UPI003426F388